MKGAFVVPCSSIVSRKTTQQATVLFIPSVNVFRAPGVVEVRPDDGVPCDADLSFHAVPCVVDDALSVEGVNQACEEDGRHKMPPAAPTKQYTFPMYFSSS